jgi:hypothetical protein
LILFEILTGYYAFSRKLSQAAVMKRVIGKVRPDVPDTATPQMKDLITRCWAHDPVDRLSFTKIFDFLDAIDFKVTQKIDSQRVRDFVNKITQESAE